MTEDKCNKAVTLHNERSKLCAILCDVEKPTYKLCFFEKTEDSMTWDKSMHIKDIKELHDILDTHHSLIIGQIKLRIEEINKMIELL